MKRRGEESMAGHDIGARVGEDLPAGWEGALAMDDPVVCAFAPVSGGKTAFLVEKARRLLGRGADAHRLLVVVNTAEQARTFLERLAATGADSAGVTVDVAHRVFVGVLTSAAQAPRILTRAELNIVIEDLKHAGVAPAHIKGMLQAMRRGLARGVCSQDWGMSRPQLDAYELLREQLAGLGATLREELSARVLALQLPEQARPYDYVLVDDAQNCSLATLKALASLACCQTVAAGNPLQALSGADPGFGPDALRVFAASTGTASASLAPVPLKPSAILSFARALCGLGFEDSPYYIAPADVDEVARTAVLHVKWREPKDEVEGICRIIKNLLDADPDLLPRDVCVAVPSRAMAAAFETELDRRRIAYQTMLDDDPVAGDPRSRERQGTLGVYGLLGLAADRDDACAWRFWLALGRSDFGCGLWQAFCEVRRSLGLSCGETALAIAGEADNLGERGETVACLPDLRACVARALESLRQLEGKRGFTLRNHLCRRYPSPQVARVFEQFDGVEEAGELFRAFQELSCAPSFADRPSQIRIGSYWAVSTVAARHVFLPGLVEGIMPSTAPAADEAAQARHRNAQRRALGCAAASAGESLTVSSFQRASVAQAQRDKLPVRRTRRYQGREAAVFKQSSFLEDAGDSMPGSVSGEQYFIDEQGVKR